MASPSIDEFTAEVEAFLGRATTPKPAREAFVWGEGSDEVSVFEEVDRDAERAELVRAKAWRATRFDAGLGWIDGPSEYGGRGLPAAYDRLYSACEARYETPDMGFFAISLGMVAPTILAHATETAKDTYLRSLYRGDLVACQLFSEPQAGSDLAGIGTRAVRDGDEWLITGQKVWTSYAHVADIGEIICRTDPDAPKHRGLTGFIVDMGAPGVEVRALRQITGGASFNEVFFDEVRVRDDHRLGEVNAGWGVALTTLMNERAAIGGFDGGTTLMDPNRLRQMLEHFGLRDDPVVRDALARTYSGFRVARLNGQRALDKIRAGQLPGPELSTGKLAFTENMRSLAAVMSMILGPRVAADSGEWGTYAWEKLICGVPGMRLAGGTDEVMRNILAERVLGLPKEPSLDTTTPFRQLASGSRATDDTGSG